MTNSLPTPGVNRVLCGNTSDNEVFTKVIYLIGGQIVTITGDGKYPVTHEYHRGYRTGNNYWI
ncbi:MAG: hypothetical protein KAU49_05895 [Candidatus Krumholzibacteria bacterium]|nr:hypothetical protein [Candidatus Krumholzibacteria bacterium]